MSCKTAGSFLHSIPDPQRICKSSASSYKSNISAQTKEQSTPHRNAECHPLCVITKATRLHQLPSRRFPPTTFAHSPQTSLPPGCSLGKRFTRGLARGALRSRRCGRTDVVSRTRIVIGSHAALPELRRRRAKAEGSVAAGLLVVTVRPAAPGAGTADMPRYAQLVMGPAGSGKVSTWREKSEFVGGRGVRVLGRWGRGVWSASAVCACVLFCCFETGMMIVTNVYFILMLKILYRTPHIFPQQPWESYYSNFTDKENETQKS